MFEKVAACRKLYHEQEDGIDTYRKGSRHESRGRRFSRRKSVRNADWLFTTACNVTEEGAAARGTSSSFNNELTHPTPNEA